MPNYTFTVRATDNAGAFADRTFSLNVLNTKQERFVAISGLDAFTSADGINWTVRSGLGGDAVSYGNGRWVITASLNRYHTSEDGINWTTYTIPGTTYPLPPQSASAYVITRSGGRHDWNWITNYTYTYKTVRNWQGGGVRAKIQYSNGVWSCYVSNAGHSAAYANRLYISTDALTWTLVSGEAMGPGTDNPSAVPNYLYSRTAVDETGKRVSIAASTSFGIWGAAYGGFSSDISSSTVGDGNPALWGAYVELTRATGAMTYFPQHDSYGSPVHFSNMTFPSQDTRQAFYDVHYSNGIWLLSSAVSEWYCPNYRSTPISITNQTPLSRSIYYSYNGTVWMRGNGFDFLSSDLVATSGNAARITNINRPGSFAYGNGVWVCGTTGTTGALYDPSDINNLSNPTHNGITYTHISYNGKDWTKVSHENLGAYFSPNDATSNISSIYSLGSGQSLGIVSAPAFSNGVFVLVGPNGILSSYDGLTWTRRLTNPNTLGGVDYRAAICDVAGIN